MKKSLVLLRISVLAIAIASFGAQIASAQFSPRASDILKELRKIEKEEEKEDKKQEKKEDTEGKKEEQKEKKQEEKDGPDEEKIEKAPEAAVVVKTKPIDVYAEIVEQAKADQRDQAEEKKKEKITAVKKTLLSDTKEKVSTREIASVKNAYASGFMGTEVTADYYGREKMNPVASKVLGGFGGLTGLAGFMLAVKRPRTIALKLFSIIP